MRILGISAYYHDSAAALIEDGRILAAAEEERFTRKKHDASFPVNAIQYCFDTGISPESIDFVAFYDKPFLKFERLLETYLAFAPRGFNSFRKALPIWLKEKLFQKNLLIKELTQFSSVVDWTSRLLFFEHHVSHAASAFYPSPFERAAILTMDGVGEWTTTSLALGNQSQLTVVKEIHFPHSLGLLYSAFTYYLGFKVNSGEYKVMGLAPYGVPRFVNTIKEHLIDIKEDGSFRLNLDYFDYCTGLTMTNSRFNDLFGALPRKPETHLTQCEMDLAASIQAITEEVVLKLTRSIAKETGERNLCLAGGVALNCVANGKVLRERCFDNIWIQPAAGDAGGALGAALAAFYLHKQQPRMFDETHDAMRGGYLGPMYDQQDIENRLSRAGAVFEILSDEELINASAQVLVEGNALGWHQGRMEFGPRSLGARSILADARSPAMQKTLNLKVKYRESFRPFAPSILREDVADWFVLDEDSPYMLLVADVLPKHHSSIPAVTHVDYSARVQTVHRQTNPRYHALISRFKALTGCPILVNTSFNIRGEPIVSTPEDAFRCFMGTEIEALSVGNCFLRKEQQNLNLIQDYKHKFDFD